jgi:hypothetical protein
MDFKKALATVGAALFATGIVGVGGVGAATPTPTSTTCGRPDEAPGFQTPARSGVVPDTTCMDLRLAEDKARAAGYDNLSSEDGTGRGRHQWVGRNWVVVAQNPAPGTPAKSRTRIVFRVLYYGDPGAPPVPDRNRPGPLPKLTCFDLQEAQDTLASAGFTRMGKEDASGRGRHPIVDRHWTVTDQNPAPGGTYSKSTRVVLRAVMNREARSCA